MVDFLLVIFAAIGFSHIIVDSELILPFKGWIAKPWRWKWTNWLADKVLYMMNCYQCSAVWSGFIVSGMLALAHHCKGLHWLEFVLYGLAASFLSVLSAVLIQYLNLAATRSDK